MAQAVGRPSTTGRGIRILSMDGGGMKVEPSMFHISSIMMAQLASGIHPTSVTYLFWTFLQVGPSGLPGGLE